MLIRKMVAMVSFVMLTTQAHADNVVADDQIVQGSQCTGIDCVSGTTFGFDIIRLDENNTRFLFNDTSASGTFPTRNWQLRANESADGGLEYFGVIDMGDTGTSTGGTRLFALEAGAPANSLYIDSNGKLGLGTAAPIVDIHRVSGNTPTLRLDQDNSQGWGAQVWDVAANETNFFVRDVTGGDQLPFRIRPGAPTSSIDIAATGDVGMGTASPGNSLHVKRSDGSARLLVEEASTTTSTRDLLTLRNNGIVLLGMENTDTGDIWDFSNRTSGFSVTLRGSGGSELLVQPDGRFIVGPSGTHNFKVHPNGDAVLAGTLTEGSSREIKENIQAVSEHEVLAKLADLSLSEWQYKRSNGSRHMGPMAEDFHATFGLGPDAKHIAPKDLAGVAMASAKALHKETGQLRSELETKEQRIEELEDRVKRLESQQVQVNELKARLARLVEQGQLASEAQ